MPWELLGVSTAIMEITFLLALDFNHQDECGWFCCHATLSS
jgi:hypothetical protein